jgi:hypothetical protein
VALALETRLRSVPYVIEAVWSPDVEVEPDGSRYIHGRVVVAAMQDLPDETPDLASFYACFDLSGVLGSNGVVLRTVKQIVDLGLQDQERRDRRARIAEALRRHERAQRELLVPNAGIDPGEFNLALVLNALWEELDWASYEAGEGSAELSEAEYWRAQGTSRGLRDALCRILAELGERGLPLVAYGAPWPEEFAEQG